MNNTKAVAGMAAAWIALQGGTSPSSATAATVAATYDFNGGFIANEAGAPALTPVDPQSSSAFQTDSVFGQTRTVWAFNGANVPTDQQAGLTLNTTNLIAPEDYSLDLVCKFTMRDGAWRRIVDVQNRQSDNGFYVDPSNNLDIYPVSGSTAAWTNNVYHHVVLTDDGTQVVVYLDGISQFTSLTSEMNLDFDPTSNPDRLLGLFVDNVVAGGQGEWSAGSVALARVWNGVLTPDQAQAIAANPFAVPEPTTTAWLSISLLGAGVLVWRRRFRAQPVA